MQKVYIEGGVIRKLWDVETNACRDHLLRLDAESVAIVSAVESPTTQFGAMPQRRAAAMWMGCCAARLICALPDRSICARPRLHSASRSHGRAVVSARHCSARNRYIKHLHVSCLPQNQRMQQLARKFGAEITFDFDTVIGVMENANPTPLSLMQEMVADGHSFAAASVDFQSRLFRPVGALVSLLPYRAALQAQ